MDEKIPHQGLLGPLLDLLVGKKTKRVNKEAHLPSMNLKTFLAYLELMRRDSEKKERERKKANMKSKARGNF